MAKKKAAKTKEEPKLLEQGMLTSNLLEPGAMIIATDKVKDGSFPPGSLGFVSFVRGVDDSYQDLAKICVVQVRVGKTGKARIQNANLSVPVFYVDHKGFDKLLPGEGDRKGFVHVERHIPMTTDVMALDPLNFLGYAVAISKRIKHMSDQCRHKKWPEDKGHPINILKRMPDYFANDPDGSLEKFTEENFRVDFVEKARRMMSRLVRVHIELDMTRVEAEVNAAEFLLFTNKGEFIPKDAEDKTNEYEFTKNNKMLEQTVDYHKKLRDQIHALYKDKRKKS